MTGFVQLIFLANFLEEAQKELEDDEVKGVHAIEKGEWSRSQYWMERVALWCGLDFLVQVCCGAYMLQHTKLAFSGHQPTEQCRDTGRVGHCSNSTVLWSVQETVMIEASTCL